MNQLPRTMNFKVMDHNLPEYIRILENGKAAVAGVVQFFDERAPVWVTESGQLASVVEESEDISISLEALPGAYGTTVTYSVGLDFSRQGGTLPFGLVMNSKTGRIEGDIPRSLVNRGDPLTFSEEERPTWDTPSQTFNYGAADEVTFQFHATPLNPQSNVTYYLRSGHLPFGLILESNGELKGEVDRVLSIDGFDIPEVTPKPRWLSPPGRIARKGEREVFEFTLEAISQLGETITYAVIDGALPFGMRLDLTTGTIYGDTAEVYYPELPVVLDRNAPIFMMEPDLGRVSTGDEVSIEILTRAFDNRTITSYAVYRDKSSGHTLPFGLVLSKEGVITGTVSEDNIPGLYRFTIVITDSAGLKSCDIFDMQVVGSEGGQP